MSALYYQGGLAHACSTCGAEATSVLSVRDMVTYGCDDHPVIEDFRYTFTANRDGVETRSFTDGDDES
jgi:hypothetical protein